jgi:excisionase family DNA binding protein
MMSDTPAIRMVSIPEGARLPVLPVTRVRDSQEDSAVDLTPLLVDARTASRLLAISPRTLWQLTRDGIVPAVRFGRSVRYAVEDLQAAIARLREAQGGAP